MAADANEREGPEEIAQSAAHAEPAFCARCRQPLTLPSASGGCLRCMADLAFLAEDETLDTVGAVEQLRRYSHFEIVLAEDGTLAELGHGAMGTTYRALDTVLQSPVALKIIGKNVADSPAVRTRFLREARAAAKLRHPNVASVFHYGEQEGECFYVMELVEGETLEAHVRREGPLPVPLVLEIGVQVARALAAAEAQKLVHRDLKPSNIMWVASTGIEDPKMVRSILVKIIDFGLAKVVAAGTEAPGPGDTRGGFVGTPAFASPEQYERTAEEHIDTRSDIYSLGVTLWYLLCGKLPFVGGTLAEVHAQQTRQPLPLEHLKAARLPGDIVALLKSMLAAAPASRPQSTRELLETLHRCQERPRGFVWPAFVRVHLRMILGVALSVAAAVGLAGWWRSAPPQPAPLADASVGVLPFENLSPDPAEAFFATGVQDSVTSDLARISQLKVVGPDNAKAFPPGNRDLPVIAQALGVSHLLEGNVRRQEGRIHVYVRLVNAQNSAQVWTAQYDRPLDDVFSVESEITREVASHLRAPPSHTEAADIDQPPTRNVAAYDLYLRATAGTHINANRFNLQQVYQSEIDLLNEAVKQDPSFVLAYCTLAGIHDNFVRYPQAVAGDGRPVDHRALAEVALENARRIQPDAGVVHLALAKHFLQISRDLGQARLELDLARRSLPNNFLVEHYAGRIARLEGRWDDAVRAFQRAVDLRPREPGPRTDLMFTYEYMRRYDEFDRTLTEAIALTPQDEVPELPLAHGMGQFESHADLALLRVTLAGIPAAKDPGYLLHDIYGIILAVFSHDPKEINRVLAASKLDHFPIANFVYPKAWFRGLAARIRNDDAAARTAFTEARADVERTVLSDPPDERNLLLLAMIDAGLGRRDDAMHEAQRACAMPTKDQDTVNTASDRCCLAVVYAWTDQPDPAFAELDKLVAQPAGDNMPCQPTYGDLCLNPLWDPLRGDLRFAALVDRLAPKSPR